MYSVIFPYQHLSFKYPHMLLRLFHVSPSVVLLFLLFLPPKPFFGRSNMVKCLWKESNIFCHVMLPTHSCWLTLDKNSSFTHLTWPQLVTLARRNIQKISEKSFKLFHSDDILFDRTEGELVSNSHWHRLKGSLLKYTLKEDRPTGDLNLRIKVEITSQSFISNRGRKLLNSIPEKKEIQS